MCRICQMLFCPPACPSYKGISSEYGRPLGRCAECGIYVYDGELYHVEGKQMLCDECAEAYE